MPRRRRGHGAIRSDRAGSQALPSGRLIRARDDARLSRHRRR